MMSCVQMELSLSERTTLDVFHCSIQIRNNSVSNDCHYQHLLCFCRYILNPKLVSEFIIHYLGLPSAAQPLLQENQHISEATRSKLTKYVHSDLIPSSMQVTKLSTIHHTKMKYSRETTLVQEIENKVLDPYFAPLMVDTLDNVTDAYIVTAQHDILRDDGIFYYSRLINSANVKCHLKNYRAGFHAFFHFVQGPLQLQAARNAVDDLIDFIQQHILEDKPWTSN